MAMNTTDKIKSCFKQLKTYLSVLGGLYLKELPQRLIQYGTQLSEQLILHIYLLSLLASPPKKQTNKQKEHWQGHSNSCGQLQRAAMVSGRAFNSLSLNINK